MQVQWDIGARDNLAGETPVTPADSRRLVLAAVAESDTVDLAHAPRVALCGPIAAPGRPAGGGYEAANRRTCDALARRGVNVVERPYPKLHRARAAKLAAYAWGFARHAAFLLCRRGQYDLLHLTPLNMHFAAAEHLLIACARLARRPVLMDVRAGTFSRHYQAGSARYRALIDASLRRADRVAVEGVEYLDFVSERHAVAPFYFPNFVDEPALRCQSPARAPQPGEAWRLVYFGRLVPEKGLDTALAALARLVARGHAVQFDLIGDGPAPWLAELRARHAALPVCFHGALPASELMALAARSQVFVFASRHDGEGHSNALNEAMSLGLVPVCSAQGFSGSVVGAAGVVLPVEAGDADYADAIEGLFQPGRWSALSAAAAARVRERFSEAATLPALIDLYRSMLAKRH